VVAVSRESRLIVGAQVLKSLDAVPMQELVDELPFAQYYCSDQAGMYKEIWWPQGSEHIISKGKEHTHTIESINANLRTYLGRLKRRSRCFSRCWEALTRAVRLFVWYHNRRQRFVNAHPPYRSCLSLFA
jgi:IS1 family transposase